jgi:xanthine dehydrogenase large subunit
MHTLPEKVRGRSGRRTAHGAPPIAHDSAARHVAGSAAYIDDMLEPEGTLHLAPGGSPVARGRVKSIDLAAVRAAPGVVAVITAADIPGHNNIGAIVADEPLFAEQEVAFHGQPLFAVVAKPILPPAARRSWRKSKSSRKSRWSPSRMRSPPAPACSTTMISSSATPRPPLRRRSTA